MRRPGGGMKCRSRRRAVRRPRRGFRRRPGSPAPATGPGQRQVGRHAV